MYEEIREEDRQRGGEISTVYTCVKFTKPNAVETTDDYSLVTAAGPQDKVSLNYCQTGGLENSYNYRFSCQKDSGKVEELIQLYCSKSEKVQALKCTQSIKVKIFPLRDISTVSV